MFTKETEHDEVFKNTCMIKNDEMIEYVKNNVLCTVFSYARYSKGMEKITGFELKSSLTSHHRH